MPKYLVQATYIGDGIKGLLKDGGSGRREAVQKMVESVGGRMEAFYFAFGDSDVFVIAELPDNAAAAAVSLTVGASGLVRTKTTVLMTPEDLDAASKRSPAYHAPGR